MNKIKIPFAAAIALTACLFFINACAHLNPGADPIVVRAEQTEAGAIAAFDLVLNVDQANRPFWRTNAPAFHQFCEWLRAPMVVNVTNTAPRGVAMVLSMNQVKLDYIASRSSSNLLEVAIATLASAVGQAKSWMSIVTNTAPAPAPVPTSWFWPKSKLDAEASERRAIPIRAEIQAWLLKSQADRERLQAEADEERMAIIRDAIHVSYMKSQLENP